MKILALSLFVSSLVIGISNIYSHKGKAEAEVNAIKTNPLSSSDLIKPHQLITKKVVINVLMTERSQKLIRARFESMGWKIDPSKILHVKATENGSSIVASYQVTNSEGVSFERYEWFNRNAFGEYEWNNADDKDRIIIPPDL